LSYTDLEKAEMVCSMPGLGDKKKPSDLMDASLAVCPSGQEMSPLFINEFLRRRPGDIYTDTLLLVIRTPCSCSSSQPCLVFPFQKINGSYLLQEPTIYLTNS